MSAPPPGDAPQQEVAPAREPSGLPESGQGDARRPGPLDDVVAVLGVYVLLGLLAAVAWWVLWEPALFTKAEGGGLGMGEDQLGRRFNADGWYAVIAAVCGLVSGTALSWWRGRDPLLTSVLVLGGSIVAAGVMAVVGGWLGPPDPTTVVASVEVGATVPSELAVDATVCYLVWPVTALIGCLIVLWSPPAVDSDRI
nr:hypothetical protein [uncultured Nocardioides sp.]